MKRIIAWFAENGVAANLLVVAILFAGLLAVNTVRQEVFPEFSTDRIVVTTIYPGAAPEEVEQGVTVRIEEEIQGIDGIKRITSTSSEGISVVTAELMTGYDNRKAKDDIASAVDGITTLPGESERPVVTEALNRRQVINVAVAGDVAISTLKRAAETARDDIAALPGVTQVTLTGVRPPEIGVEIGEEMLRSLGLTFDAVASAVRAGAVDLPGGALKTDDGEILIRTVGQAETGDEIARIPLLVRPDGGVVTVGEAATVIDGFEDTGESARFDGAPTALVQVFRVGDQSALDISRRVKAYVADTADRMPPGVSLTTWEDTTRILQGRMDLLVRNGIQGLVLVFITLALFLRMRLALWVMAGIPLSFLGAMMMMPWIGVSINLISLFAFIIVLGLVVDDAIVVGESVFTRQGKRGGSVTASIAGTNDVSTPVIFGVLTSIAAFAPLLFVEGTMGKVMSVIPAIVIPTLFFSLVESQLALPRHLIHVPPTKPTAENNRWDRFQRRFADGMMNFVKNVYRPQMELLLGRRYLALSAFIAVLFLTIGVVGSGLVRFTFMPNIEADNVVGFVTMPQGTPEKVTAEVIGKMETAARKALGEAERESDGSVWKHLLSTVGEQPFRTRQQGGHGAGATKTGGAHLGEVNIELAPSEERSVSSDDIAARWRDAVGPIPGAVELSFASSLFSAGEAINVQLTGLNMEELRQAADDLKKKLATYPPVFDITDSYRAGKQEVSLTLTRAGETAGVTLLDLGRQVRQAFHGAEALRIQRGRDDVKVMVRYPENERASLTALDSFLVRRPDGVAVPLSSLATVTVGRGYAAIKRVDRRRAINVTTDLDLTRATSGEILADLSRGYLPELTARYPGVGWSLEGQQREQSDSMGSLVQGFLFALVAIYAMMAIPLRSYLQPAIIMLAIPFGLIGAIWGHAVMGLDLTMLSMMGIVALTGVVVNSSLVLVSNINDLRHEGESLADAIREAGVARFRPIVLTAMTTFAGVTPLILERSVQAKFLIPMAVSLGFGVLFATFISLMLVPVSYLILEDVSRWLGRFIPGFHGVDEYETKEGR